MAQPLGLIRLALPDGSLVIKGTMVTKAKVSFHVRPRCRQQPHCPSCGGSRVTLHSHYRRRLRDVPWSGRRVELVVGVRRFRCRSSSCPRRIFAEQLPLVARRRARETVRAGDLLRRFGYALGGLPAVRLLGHLGLGTSADTVLRRLKGVPRERDGPDVRVLGVDDWAWLKHQRYGTILMDLKKNQVSTCCPFARLPA